MSWLSQTFSNLIAPKNWSEWVFGGGLPIQAALRTQKQEGTKKAQQESDNALATATTNQNIAAMGGDVVANAERRRRYGFLSTILAGSLPSLGMGLGGTDTTKKNKLG